jgi:hypothetical protein
MVVDEIGTRMIVKRRKPSHQYLNQGKLIAFDLTRGSLKSWKKNFTFLNQEFQVKLDLQCAIFPSTKCPTVKNLLSASPSKAGVSNSNLLKGHIPENKWSTGRPQFKQKKTFTCPNFQKKPSK